MRRVLLIIVIVILCGGVGVIVSLYARNHSLLRNDPFLAVSPSAALIVETQDVQEFINALSSNSGMVNELRTIPSLANVFAKIDFLNGWFGSHNLTDIRGGNVPSLFVIEPSSEGAVGVTLIGSIGSSIKKSDILPLFQDSTIVGISPVLIDNYEAYSVEYALSDTTDSFFIAIQSGLAIVSSTVDQMQSALNALSSIELHDIRNNPSFARLFNVATTEENRLYVIYNNLSSVLEPLFSDERRQLALEVISKATISGFDIFLDNNSLSLNGYSDGTNFSTISGAPLHRLEGFKLLPASTALFELFDCNAFNTNVQISSDSLLPQTNTLLNIIQNQVEGEIIKAYIDIKGNAVKENQIVIYRLKDGEFAESSFKEAFLNRYNTRTTTHKPNKQTSIPIYQISIPQFAASMLPNLTWDFDDEYFAFYENNLITSSNYSTIIKVLDDNIAHRTLANDVKFREFEASMPSTANFWLYFVPAYIDSYFSEFLSSEASRFISANEMVLHKIQAIGYQLTQSNGMLYNNISVQYQNQEVSRSVTEWETMLDTAAAIKPFFFTNHNTKAKEIFIQDLKNNIYLINSAGRILWKVPINESIEGEIYMIDIFKNGRNQLLFASKNYLYVVDRNGNYVGNYPVRLRSTASNSLSLFDYDNNKDYRLAIAGEDNQVYIYDKNGTLVKGWNIFKANDAITTPISWIRSSGRDYIVVTDKTSTYFLDRTGKNRLTLKESVSRAEGSALRLVGGKTPIVVCSSSDGTIQQIGFDGTVNKLTLGNFSKNHYFDLYDLDGNGLMEYIFVDGNKLYVYNNDGSLRFEKQIGLGALEKPLTFSFSAKDNCIGVYAPTESRIYLFDSEGTLSEGFPLHGMSQFSIGHLSNNNSWNLVVAGNNNAVYNYLVNR